MALFNIIVCLSVPVSISLHCCFPYWLVIAPTTETLKDCMNQVYHSGNNLFINPTYIVSVPEFSGNIHSRSMAQEKAKDNLKGNKHGGELSNKARTKMKNAINWLLVSSKAKRVWCKKSNKTFYFKVSFITLTVPLVIEKPIKSSEIKGLLHAWLMYARKYYYLRNYVWKLEAQKNGQLHIHITSDSFIHHRKLRDSWNRLLQSKGFLDEHYGKFNNYNPNSTDIHSVKSVKNIASYLCEYMSKKSKLPPGFAGRIWSCNYSLSAKNKCSVNISADELSKELRTLYSKDFRSKNIISRCKRTGTDKNVAEIFFMNEVLWQKLKGCKLHEAYNAKRFRIKNDLPDIPPDYFYLDQINEMKPKIDICVTDQIIPTTGLMKLDQPSSLEINSSVRPVGLNIGKQLDLIYQVLN